MYDFKQLISFVTLARNLHFGKTACELRIAQPTLSLQIRGLEKELGGLLFRRTSRSVTLTPLGEVFLKDAQIILANIDLSKRNAEIALLGKSARLLLGVCSGIISSGIFAAVLERMQAAMPQVRVECEELPPGRLVRSLEAGRIDVMLANTFGLNLPQGAVVRPVATWEAKLIYRKSLASGDGSLARETLLKLPFIAYEVEDEYPHIVENILNFEPSSVIRTPSARVMMALVNAGSGAAIVPDADLPLAGPDTAWRTITDTSGNPKQMTAAAVHLRFHNTSLVRNFFAMLDEIDFEQFSGIGALGSRAGGRVEACAQGRPLGRAELCR